MEVGRLEKEVREEAEVGIEGGIEGEEEIEGGIEGIEEGIEGEEEIEGGIDSEEEIEEVEGRGAAAASKERIS